MYRIKLASGAETTYQSIDELTNALHGGEVNAEALIYHQRADRWLPVNNHPHYQIALARLQAPRAPEASRRQVVPAVRPEARSSNGHSPAVRVAPAAAPSEVPPTVVRKLTIPTSVKTDSSILRAQENVLEGVVVVKPTSNGNGNGHAPASPVKQETVALPLRATPPAASRPKSVHPANTQIPDLGSGLDLVESESWDELEEHSTSVQHSTGNGDRGTPNQHKSPHSATPQVDKLLSLLEPSNQTKTPATTPSITDVEVIDLNAPIPAKHAHHASAPAVPVPVANEPVLETPHPKEHVVRGRRAGGRKTGFVTGAGIAVVAVGLMFWHPWSARAASGKASPSPTVGSIELPHTEAFGGLTSVQEHPGDRSSDSPSASAGARDSAAARARASGDSAPAIVRVAAPRIKMSMPISAGAMANLNEAPAGSANISASTLAQHYAVAFSDARSEMEMRMLQIGFTQLFLRSRLATTSGLQDTRRLIASASSAVRQYRSQEARIERAYQDTMGIAGRNLGWSPRDLSTWNAKPTQREAPETIRLTGLFLSQMDSVFSLLLDQDGKYHLNGESIVFDDADAARQYGVLRAWLSQQADTYSGSGDASLPGTLRQMTKAIGTTRLPQERHK